MYLTLCYFQITNFASYFYHVGLYAYIVFNLSLFASKFQRKRRYFGHRRRVSPRKTNKMLFTKIESSKFPPLIILGGLAGLLLSYSKPLILVMYWLVLI